MNEWGGFETWGPPAVVLGLGVIIGLVVAFRSREDAPGTDPWQAEREALLARKQTLLEQIRGLDAERGRFPPEEIASRKDALIDEAAGVLSQLDALEQGTAPGVGSAEPTVSINWSGRATWAVAVLGFFVVLGVGLTEFARPRNGGSMTGGDAVEAMNAGRGSGESAAAAESSPARAAATRRLAAAQAAVDAAPEDLDALNALTYEALLLRDFQTAMDTVERARTVSPDDPHVQVHLGILQLSVGMTDRAEPAFENAAIQLPDAGKPRLWLGLLQLQTGRRELAAQTLGQALSKGLRSDEAAFAQSLLMEARQPAAGGAPAAAPAAETASVTSEASGEPRLSGIIALDEGVVADPDKRVFLIVHRNEAGKGPPLAVRPLRAADLPATFTLTDADQMMSKGPWPDQVWVFARLDADGVAGSGPGDLESARLGPFPPGTEGVSLLVRAP